MLDNFIFIGFIENRIAFKEYVDIRKNIYPMYYRKQENLKVTSVGTIYFDWDIYEFACYKFDPDHNEDQEFPIWGPSVTELVKDDTAVLCYEHCMNFKFDVKDPLYKKYKIKSKKDPLKIILLKAKCKSLFKKNKDKHATKQENRCNTNQNNQKKETKVSYGTKIRKGHLFNKIKNIVGINTKVDVTKQPKVFDTPTKTSKDRSNNNINKNYTNTPSKRTRMKTMFEGLFIRKNKISDDVSSGVTETGDEDDEKSDCINNNKTDYKNDNKTSSKNIVNNAANNIDQDRNNVSKEKPTKKNTPCTTKKRKNYWKRFKFYAGLFYLMI